MSHIKKLHHGDRIDCVKKISGCCGYAYLPLLMKRFIQFYQKCVLTRLNTCEKERYLSSWREPTTAECHSPLTSPPTYHRPARNHCAIISLVRAHNIPIILSLTKCSIALCTIFSMALSFYFALLLLSLCSSHYTAFV